jgi:hypothetical protein
MEDEEIQKHLTFVTGKKVKALHSNKIIGVTAIWKDDTACLSFYFNEEPTENELDDLADICTEIIAQMPKGMLEDKYLTLKSSDQLPKEFLAYKKSENSHQK